MALCTSWYLLLLLACNTVAQDDGDDGGDSGGGGPKPCIFTAADGTTFNLAGLTRKDSDFTDKTSGGFTYQFNICGNTKKVCNKQPAPASKWRGGKCNNLGDIDTQTLEAIDPADPKKGVRIKYNEGDICKKQQDGQTQIETRAVSYDILCDASKTTAVLKEIKEVNMCEYTIIFEAAAACPASGGGGSAKNFLIFLLVGVVLYCGIGIGLNKYRFGTPVGLEAVPNLEFWKEVPALVRDGLAFSTEMSKRAVAAAQQKYEEHKNAPK